MKDFTDLRTKQYIKKPELVNAIQFTNTSYIACAELLYGAELAGQISHTELRGHCNMNGEYVIEIVILFTDRVMYCRLGDYIIKDNTGEIHVCNKDTFNQMYEEVKE